jgi:hypothetical protein
MRAKTNSKQRIKKIAVYLPKYGITETAKLLQ